MNCPTKFLHGYITAMLWAGTDDRGISLDSVYDISDIHEDSMTKIVADCNKFYTENQELLSQAGDDSQNGHDFLLTRNGHGAGFWDRGYGEIGESLSGVCKEYGETNIYVGDDDQLHV